MLKPGLYEQTISQVLRGEINKASPMQDISEGDIDSAEASRVLSAYVEKAVRQSLDGVSGRDALQRQVKIVNWGWYRFPVLAARPRGPGSVCIVGGSSSPASA